MPSSPSPSSSPRRLSESLQSPPIPISPSTRPLHVVFVHLDLGLGGAEQLVLQLACASQDLGHHVDLVTTRCEPHHCFAHVKPPTGRLYQNLHIWGTWIPATILGRGRTFCSTLRLLYLAYRTARKKSPDLVVLDVLPTPLWLLRLTDSALLYYCHFPDKLLKQQGQHGHNNNSLLTRWYRTVMDGWEEQTLLLADTIVVNSLFTRHTVRQTFPSLQSRALPVLYPALDTSSLDDNENENSTSSNKQYMLVSLNRYERKKNLDLFLEAVAWMRTHRPNLAVPKLVIAGGYDIQNVENVEYRAELGTLAAKLNLVVDFRQSISEAERAHLLHTALAVVYTPQGEHFGIVPLEAMYAGTPVVCVKSGGPKETVLDGTTGYLCENTPASFGQALVKLLENPQHAAEMGQAGRKHVQETFGEERLLREWKKLTEETVLAGRARLSRAGQYRLARSIIYIVEALVTLIICLLLTWLLRQVGALQSGESIWGRLVRGRDEL